MFYSYIRNDYRNQFSTPSNNQNPPPPNMLQATIIPTMVSLFFVKNIYGLLS